MYVTTFNRPHSNYIKTEQQNNMCTKYWKYLAQMTGRTHVHGTKKSLPQSNTKLSKQTSNTVYWYTRVKKAVRKNILWHQRYIQTCVSVCLIYTNCMQICINHAISHTAAWKMKTVNCWIVLQHDLTRKLMYCKTTKTGHKKHSCHWRTARHLWMPMLRSPCNKMLRSTAFHAVLSSAALW